MKYNKYQTCLDDYRNYDEEEEEETKEREQKRLLEG